MTPLLTLISLLHDACPSGQAVAEGAALTVPVSAPAEAEGEGRGVALGERRGGVSSSRLRALDEGAAWR